MNTNKQEEKKNIIALALSTKDCECSKEEMLKGKCTIFNLIYSLTHDNQ
jgi:hypothetical protein